MTGNLSENTNMYHSDRFFVCYCSIGTYKVVMREKQRRKEDYYESE